MDGWMDKAKEFKRDSKCAVFYAGLLLGWSTCCWLFLLLFSHFKLSSRPQGMRERHAQREGYLFPSGFSSLYDAIHGWMTEWMDRWMKKVS
jgi:hypothetical protein